MFLDPSSLCVGGGGFTLTACMEPSFIFFLLLAEAEVCDKQLLISINKPLMGHEAYQHLLGGAGRYFLLDFMGVSYLWNPQGTSISVCV